MADVKIDAKLEGMEEYILQLNKISAKISEIYTLIDELKQMEIGVTFSSSESHQSDHHNMGKRSCHF